MLRDLGLASWLWARHVWKRLVFWGYAAGADLEREDFMERMYDLYLVAILAAWVWGMLSFAVHQLAAGFAALPAGAVLATMRAAQLAPVALAAYLATRALRSTPLKFSAPDIAYLAASRLSVSALVLVRVLAAAVNAAFVGALAGYAAGVGMWAAHRGADPVAAAGFGAMLAVSLVLTAWLLGVVRLAAGRWISPYWWVLPWPAAALAVLALPEGGPIGAAVLAALTGAALAPIAQVLAAVLAIELVVLLLVASRADVTLAIDESALFAEMEPLRLLKRIDPIRYRQIARKKRLSLRVPRYSLPMGEGGGALVSRALGSHVRQPTRLLPLLVWAGVVTPSGALMFALHASAFVYPAWIALALAGFSAELGRVFGDDVEHQGLREMLPFRSAALLAFDAVPAATVAIVCSLIALAVATRFLGGLEVFAQGMPLAVLLTPLAVACRGIGLVELGWTRRHVSFEVSMGIGLVLVCMGGLLGGVLLATTAAAVSLALATAAMRSVRVG